MRGTLPCLKLPAGGQAALDIPLGAAEARTAGEYALRVRFTLREDCLWAPAGHEVAWADMPLPQPRAAAPAVKLESMPRLAARLLAGGDIRIDRSDFRLRFDATAGTIAEWSYLSVPLLTAGPQVQLWRAPIDNECTLPKIG